MNRSRPFSPARWFAPAAAVAVAMLAWSSAAFATPSVAGKLTQLPDQPLAATSATCANLVASQQQLGSTNFPDAEVEPQISVDPTDANHLVAAFQQDRWSDGGSNGLTTAVSFDGGKHWQLASSQPRFSICEGATSGSAGFFNRATDPWVSFAPNGVVFQVSDSFNANGPAFGGASSIIVSRSTDGGLNWGAPTTILLDTSTTVLNDKESITADPTDASRAFITWDRLVSPNQNSNPSAFTFAPAFRGPSWFSSTSDGGQTWSPARIIFDPGQRNQTIGNQIVVEPDGTLIDGINLITNQAMNTFGTTSVFNVAVLRSTDHGATFSNPVIVSGIVDAPVTVGGQAVRTGDILPEFSVNPTTGTLYATWQDGRFSGDGHAGVAISQSTDEGLTWSAPIEINQTPNAAPAFTPQVHVSSDGTVGVTYYDLRNATPFNPSGTSAGTTEYFLVHCHAALANCTSASNWTSETQLDNPPGFDMTTAPVAGGFFTGDYEGLTAMGTTFGALVVLARPEATQGPTDPFFNTATL